MSAAECAFVATVPRGLADLLAQELRDCGAAGVVAHSASVAFTGPLEVGYRACLWSRVASRVLLRLFEVEAADADSFYEQARRFDWEQHLDPNRTLACDFTGTHPTITNTHFGALRLKDAVCDRLREVCGQRPDVSVARPAVRLSAHAHGQQLTVLLDLAGEGLHRRGYRLEASGAPLRENLAAGLLLRARWPEAAARGESFLDPMCGSGTLVIEAALIAAGRAPALLRDYFGFLGWKQHDAPLWQRLTEQARAKVAADIASVIRGSDIDPTALAQAQANAQRAQVERWVRFARCPITEVRPPSSGTGLICTNPPYGERLGDAQQAQSLHQELGGVLREHFAGWDAAILTAAPAAAGALKLRSYRVHELWNGPIACRLLRIDLSAPGAEDLQSRVATLPATPGAAMFANRLRKNLQRLARPARREDVSCYRLYDADMPEYAFAIDRYLDAEHQTVHLSVQEYAAPASVEAHAARQRRIEALAILPSATDIAAERVHLRTRRRRRGGTSLGGRERAEDEARSRGGTPAHFVVREGGLAFRVDLEGHFDSGLFLDHRLTRALIRAQARGARFLNLFCYTASATVYAAAGGARSSLSVDLSQPTLEWAAANFALNGIDASRHRLLRADCRVWLEAAGQRGAAGEPLPQFDLIFLDPPTFSNSKRMQGVLDVQRDHVGLIEACLRLLAPHGLLLFSSNAQRFRLDPCVAERWQVKDISAQTLPFDFVRHPRIHRCFEIRNP